jgi:signal transduction histidine kinase
MNLFQRHRWFVAAAGITLAFAAVSLTAHQSRGLAAFADLSALFLTLIATSVTLANAVTGPRSERSFWAMISLGLALWASNDAAWTWFEVLRRQEVPDPFFFDVILFFHTLPMIAAVAWRPDLGKKEGKIHLSALNFLMLLGWWVFLYAFIVFPHQYVVANFEKYNLYYDRLYAVENAMLLAALALAIWTSSGGWRKFYLHFLGATLLYSVNSQLLDRASAQKFYYSGSPYDIPLIATVVWMAAAALSARNWELKTIEYRMDSRWKQVVPRAAMLVILSLPVLGLWSILFDKSPAPTLAFRLFAVLCAMLFLGAFVFFRQFFQNQALMALLRDSRHNYEGQKRLQNQLVQKEKLASLGTLVAGAAREINHPLASIMNNSEQLWAQPGLTEQQNALLRKIVHQASRTRDLVANLLSFAQQSPAEKQLVDLSILLSRAAQLLESRLSSGQVRVSVSIQPDLPRVRANANQIFQAFVEIIENAVDAVVEANGSGTVEITARRHVGEVLLAFSDNGPGVREPDRVFDPFYTTKAVGKGTGLGLSVVYGVIRDHGGQITCQNRPEGGALFAVRLPVAAESAAHVAGATAG